MKKTLSAIFALVFAFAAVFAVACIASAEEDVDDGRVTTTTATTTAATTTEATTTETTTVVTTTKLNNNSESDTAAVKEADGTTINADAITEKATETPATAASKVTKTTARATAAVISNVPYTGSSVVVPAVAVLALLCGTVAVVKTKKD